MLENIQVGCIYGCLLAGLPECAVSMRYNGVRFKGVGLSIIGRHLCLEFVDGTGEGALQFAQGGVVPAIAVVLQEKRGAAKHADQNLRGFVAVHSGISVLFNF